MASYRQRPIDTGRFVSWMIGGIGLGIISAFIVAFSIPSRYESRAVVATTDRVSGETFLSLTQATLIEREFNLAKHDDPPEKISLNTRLRCTPGSVEIIASSSNPLNARDITRETARRFRSLGHERHLTHNPVPVPPLSEADPHILSDLETISRLLSEQATEIGIPHFLQVPTLAASGDAAASALNADTDFARRFKRYEEISAVLGLDGIPGEPYSSPLPLITAPEIPERPVNSYGRLLGFLGKTIGVILGVILAFRFGRKPLGEDVSTNQPAKPVEPSVEKTNPTPGSGPARSPDEW